MHADLTELTADDFALFTRLPELDYVQIYSFHAAGHRGGKQLTEDHLRHLGQVPSLRCLSLSDTEVIGPAMTPLRGHPHSRV